MKKGRAEQDKISWTKEIDLIDKSEADGSINEFQCARTTTLKADLCQATFLDTQIWDKKCKRLWNL